MKLHVRRVYRLRGRRSTYRRGGLAGTNSDLASVSNERSVNVVAVHLGLFDGWFASSTTENLSSSVKAGRLGQTRGAGGFDYIGNSAADLAVWCKARRRIAVHPSDAVERELLAFDPTAVVLRRDGPQLRNWVKLPRVQQWARNVLVFVPLVTARHLDLSSIGEAVAAVFVFSLAASGICLINDLLDLDADRIHRTEKRCPVAAGTIRVLDAMLIAPVLVAAAVAGAFLLAPSFGAVLLGYLALTTAYTFVLKRKMMIDVVTLAMLYTLRVVGGAAAIAVPVSEWLLAFSLFIIVVLVLIKRYTELAGRLDANMPGPTNRNCRQGRPRYCRCPGRGLRHPCGDRVDVLHLLGHCAPTLRPAPGAVADLFGPDILDRAHSPAGAQTADVHDDPIVFSLQDANSLACAVIIAFLFLLAVVGVPFDISGIA